MFGRKEQQRVRVLVADDHLAVAEGLRAVLEPSSTSSRLLAMVMHSLPPP